MQICQKRTGRKTFCTVCKTFFLRTFDISNRRFRTVCLKTDHVGVCGKDQRGRQPTKKMDPKCRELVTEHIKMFPTYIRHYSRKSNLNAKDLSHDLNLNKMYKMYVELYQQRQVNPVKPSYYRYILTRNST